MKTSFKIGCLAMGLTMVFAVSTGCFSDKKDSYYYYDYSAKHESMTNFISFYSSDENLDAFLNDFAERHMRDTMNKIGTQAVGIGSMQWKDWETRISSWWDASAENGTMSGTYATKDLNEAFLSAPKQDREGYVWTDTSADVSSWGMGWQFPSYLQAGAGWTFDTAGITDGWTVNGGSASVSGSKLVAQAVSATETLELVSPEFAVQANITPFFRVGLEFAGSGSYQIEDLYLYYKTSSDTDWSDGRRMSFKEMCTTGFDIGSGNIEKGSFFFPTYMDEKWGQGSSTTVKQVKIVLKAENGTTFRGKLSLDYACTEFDDRLPTNPSIYIAALKNAVEYSQDAEFLNQVLPYARRAMNYLLHQLQGAQGLVSTKALVGHYNKGLHTKGSGMASGYWDVLAMPEVNIYANIYFYDALVAMSYLEKMAEFYNVDSYDDVITTEDIQNDKIYTYTQTSESLDKLADVCKTKMQAEFWNDQTGRFHAGHYDTAAGEAQDHGYLLFNEQLIASGIATQKQAESVMQWINGERKIANDESKGDDIYYFEFAPRFNTDDIGTDFYWGYSTAWNGNVQNGGTALHLSYYDLLAQAVVNKDNSFARLKNIQKWYENVQQAGGEGLNFYREYYKDIPDMPLQGNDTQGILGLDYEWLEAAILMAAVPDAYFGLSAGYNNVLRVEPSLPAALDFWKMENLTFSGYYYDLSIGHYFVEISDILEYRDGSGSENAKIEIVFAKPNFNFKLYVNDVETSDFIIDENQLSVSVPFDDVKVEIKKV